MKLEPKQWARSDMKHSEHYGKWFVTASKDHLEYLHRDSVVRRGTYFEGVWSGFFPTQESANAAIEAYQARSEVKP